MAFLLLWMPDGILFFIMCITSHKRVRKGNVWNNSSTFYQEQSSRRDILGEIENDCFFCEEGGRPEL